jgi:hypothetical protein
MLAGIVRNVRYKSGRFGFDRSLPENPALINASLRAGISMAVNRNAASENPTDAWRGCPSLLKINAAEATRPARVTPDTKIDALDDIFRTLLFVSYDLL